MMITFWLFTTASTSSLLIELKNWKSISSKSSILLPAKIWEMRGLEPFLRTPTITQKKLKSMSAQTNVKIKTYYSSRSHYLIPPVPQSSIPIQLERVMVDSRGTSTMEVPFPPDERITINEQGQFTKCPPSSATVAKSYAVKRIRRPAKFQSTIKRIIELNFSILIDYYFKRMVGS